MEKAIANQKNTTYKEEQEHISQTYFMERIITIHHHI